MSDTLRVRVDLLEEFVRSLLAGAKVAANEAENVAGAIAWCDMVGRHTQGIWRLPNLVERIEAGVLHSPCEWRIDRTGASTARIEGGAGIGYHLGHTAMVEAVSLARDSGIGAVTVSGSDHFGAGSYYGALAARAGMIGVATSNAFPKVAAHGGRTPVLGTNPFSIAFPLKDGPVLIDFSTAPISGAALRRAASGAADVAGHLIPGADASPPVMRAEGPKGFAMGLMVEILSGVLSGAGVASELGSTVSDLTRPANLGHFMLAIDPARFVGGSAFEERLRWLVELVRASLPALEGEEVRIPGDARHRARKDSLERGICLSRGDLVEVEALATRLQVSTPW